MKLEDIFGKAPLFVHAHPDDETLQTGALLAACHNEGLRTTVVTATRGERGEIVQGVIPLTQPSMNSQPTASRNWRSRSRPLEWTATTGWGTCPLERRGLARGAMQIPGWSGSMKASPASQRTSKKARSAPQPLRKPLAT